MTIREAFNELELWSNTAKFSLVEQTDSQGEPLVLIRDWAEVTSKIGDNQCLLQAMKDSSFYPAFADRANIWASRLSTLDSALHIMQQVQGSTHTHTHAHTVVKQKRVISYNRKLGRFAFYSHNRVEMQVQRRWTYLDPILGQGALPSESSRFNSVSDEFK